MIPHDIAVEISEVQLNELSAMTDGNLRTQFLAHQQLYSPAVARQLSDASRTKLRIDPRQSLWLAEAAIAVARFIDSEELLGPGLRAKANALYVLGDNQAAVDSHDQALAIFQRQANREEEARTLNALIQPCILLGNYDRALESARSARDIFELLGDKRRLAYVEINVGNLYHRQDRFDEALAGYQRAYEVFLSFNDSEGIGIALYNMSVCLISTNDFPRALATYQRARETFVARGMTLLVGQADYNIAYLYYLRGEYSQAITMLRAAREQSEKNGDAHILALCYLDLSDVYLELNLSSEAAQVADEGVDRFRKLGMGYEEAKCLANKALAWSQQGRRIGAIDLFAEARAVFAREKNQVWPWLVDLYRSLALFDEGRFFEARKCCKSALGFFETSTSPGKAVLCQLLLSRLELREGNFAEALQHCQDAMARLVSLDMPILEYQAHYVTGQIYSESGNQEDAYIAYQKARQRFEAVRSKLRKEELKIAFIKGESDVYERLIEICLGREAEPAALAEAFQYVELAKYQSPAEMLLDEIHDAPISMRGNSDMVRRLRNLREELNWYYHRIEIAQLSSDHNDPARIHQLQAEARTREQAIVEVLQDLPVSSPEMHHLRPSTISSLGSIQAALTPKSSLIEYFAVDGQLFAALLTAEQLQILPVSLSSTVANLVQKFRAHLSKVALAGSDSAETPQLRIVQGYLQSLNSELIQPLVERLSGEHLVFVPHGPLHLVPFHALFDGERYLIDRFTVSYAPSASIYERSRSRSIQAAGPTVLLAVGTADEAALPQHASELARALKTEQQFALRDIADEKSVKRARSASRLHIANLEQRSRNEVGPLGVSAPGFHLSPSQIYQLRLQTALLSLSGFAAGLDSEASHSVRSFGPVRCFLEAGTRAVLSMIWEAQQSASLEFFRTFAQRQEKGTRMAKAFQEALQHVRNSNPHPFSWAPFVISGDVATSE